MRDFDPDNEPSPEIQEGWPKYCHKCGAPDTAIRFSYDLGYWCVECGGTDADE